MTTSDHTPVVVVGTDGSDCGTAAVEWAADHARAIGGTLHIVTAWEWPVCYGYPIAPEGWYPKDDAETIADKAAAAVQLPAERIQVSVKEGPAGPVLVRASEGAEVLVVGSHGHRAVTSMLLGSVSAYCVHHAHVPVVVAR